MPAISVVLTTYERPQALACVLEMYGRQTFRDFELILADDGSGPETRSVVEKYRAQIGVPFQHLWTEHQDHGRTRIINNALRHATGEYVIQSDGDCIPEPNFVETHWKARKPGVFLNGRRLMLPDCYRDLTPEQVVAGEHRNGDVASSWRDIHQRERKALWYRFLGMFGGMAWSRLRLLGANVSMWRQDLEAINGFDEGYVGWGAADEDLRRRLHDAGIKWGSVMTSALLWHIPHPPIASKPAKVKEGRNAGRYDAWMYLTRPILGMRHRAPEELLVGLPGDPSAQKLRVIETSAGPRPAPVEIGIDLVGFYPRPFSKSSIAVEPPGAPHPVDEGWVRLGAEFAILVRSQGISRSPHLPESWPGRAVSSASLPPVHPGETPEAYAQRARTELVRLAWEIMR